MRKDLQCGSQIRIRVANADCGDLHLSVQDAAHQYHADGTDESEAQGDSGSARVMRGVPRLGAPENCRAAARYFFAPQGRRDFIGFRFARKIEP
jgi:formylglycine-generating enzyme required for sulfatase activity